MLKIKNSTILVGLSLSEHDQNLILSAANLAKRTQSKLVLAHAILPFQAYAYAGEGAFYPMASYENSFRELSEVMGMEKLEELKSSISSFGDQGVDISIRVVHNDPALGLGQLAKEVAASLLICGFRPERVQHDFFGMSTALLLMSEAPCPVLSLPLDREFRFDGSIAFADDLQEETLAALQTTCEFLQEIDAHKLYHVHINNISERDVQSMTEMVKSGMLLGKIPSNPDFDKQYYIDKTTDLISENMSQRFHNLPESLQQNVQYQTEVGFGSPAKKLKAVLEDIKAELVVFGTHKFFDRSSWSFGKMPYHSMVSMNCGVLIIPEKEST
ncbi:MAG: universal stress protein [Oligoflexus sp.]